MGVTDWLMAPSAIYRPELLHGRTNAGVAYCTGLFQGDNSSIKKLRGAVGSMRADEQGQLGLSH
jgi:hypothetical protein